jgi:16S rRNA (guanine966-N2)-methyltransferase
VGGRAARPASSPRCRERTAAALTRIIAGAARGRRLTVPKGTVTRPTSDRAREGLFATVTTIHGPLPGARVLDLYAGSGAVGLEALSRGAARVVFVESDPRAARVIRANLAAVALPGGELACCPVQRFLDRGPGAEAAFDLVVADPPYAASEAEVTGMLTALASGGWLAPGALVAVERATRANPLPWPAGYRADRSRRYGEATFWYGLAAAEAS